MVNLNIKLPDGFLDEEVRCGYTVSKEMKQLWAVELDLAVELQRVCNKYGIKYFADSGTVLGAVRHKGFIPWDDDMDFAMDRENYVKLCEHASEFKYPYFFQTEETDHGSYRGHAQLRRSDTTGILVNENKRKSRFNQGIFIDIFPFDKIPEDEREQKEYILELDKLKARYRNRLGFLMGQPSINPIKNIVKKILRPVACLIDSSLNITYKYFEEYDDYKSIYNKTDSHFAANLQLSSIDDYIVVNGDYFGEAPIIMDFEFIKVPIPSSYDEYLVTSYGNYKEYVIGTNFHGGLIVDTDKSYIEYLGKKVSKNNDMVL